MGFADRRLAASTLRSILTALLASGGNGTGQSGADLYRLCGALSASASETVASGAFASDLKDCFDAARVSGATFAGMQEVQGIVQSVSTANGAVQRVAQTALRFSLVQMALIVAATTFTSRADVDAALQAVNAAFEPGEDYAANQRNNVVFRALVALHASVVRDLTRRGRPLPSIVPFNLGQSLPALTISNRLYGAGDRAGELIAENKCVHPLFMKGVGKALAV